MTISRVILHAGPSKTGTTTIQASLNSVFDDLLKAGICYPGPSPIGQPWLAWETLEQANIPVVRLTSQNFTWEQAFAQAAENNCRTLLLSAEDFTLSQFKERAFEQLRAILGDVPIDFVFGLRDPLAVMRSTWQHSVRWNAGGGEQTKDFHEAIESLATLERISVVPYVERVKIGLKPRSMKFYTVPRTPDSQTLLRRFSECAGIEMHLPAMLAKTPLTKNQSLPFDQVMLLLRVNQAISKAEKFDPTGTILDAIKQRAVLLKALDKWKGDSKEFGEMPKPAKDACSAIRHDILSWVQDKEIVGDLADLLDTPEASPQKRSILQRISWLKA